MLSNNSGLCPREGALLSVITYVSEGVTGTVDPSTGVIGGKGEAESILRDLQFILNFRVTLNTLVSAATNGEDYLAQIAGEMARKKSELAIGYFYFTSVRAVMATPLMPIDTDSFYILFAQPPPSSVRNIFTVPISLTLLLVTLLVLVGIGLVLATSITTKFRHFIPQGIFWMVTTICQKHVQSPEHGMDKIFNRILCLTGFLLSFSVYSVFSGRLLSVLISPEVAVKKVEDLLTFGYTLYSLPAIQHMIFNNQTIFRNTQSESYHWRVSLQNVLDKRHANIGALAISGYYAYTRSLSPAPSIPTICGRISVLQFSHSNAYFTNGFYVPKDSAWKGRFNFGIIKIRERGLLLRYKKFDGSKISLCVDKTIVYRENLGIDDVLSVFILYAVASILAGILIVAESLMKIVYDY